MSMARSWTSLAALLLSTAFARGADAQSTAATPPESVRAQGAAEGADVAATERPAPDAPATSGGSADKASDTRAEALRAYQAALESQKLAATAPLSTARLQADLAVIEDKLLNGRRDEAIADLVYLVESPRFDPFAKSEEGRAALFLLGDSLARAGAVQPARGYLLRLFEGAPADTWFRRAADSMVDLGLESDRPEVVLRDLDKIEGQAPPEVQGDIEYLRGRTAELGGDRKQALEAYSKVVERSRFWAQATYLSGVLEVEAKHFKRGEELFCKVADPRLTPKRAAVFGGSNFFRVRDLSRLGLGRVAHEQYRFDDARYYYYLVPNDSERLPEALYETATTRYESKDYRGAREALDDLKRLKVEHPYQDEAWILDAYVDLAVCHFPEADRKLSEFITRYEPARNAARKIAADDGAMRRLAAAVRRGTDPAGAGLGVPEETARALGVLLRVDQGYLRTGRRLSEVDHQLAGLRGTMGELDEARRKLAAGNETKPQSESPLGQRPLDKVGRIDAQISELKRVLREAERAGPAQKVELEALQKELEGLELRAKAVRAGLGAGADRNPSPGADLNALIDQDRKRASEMYRAAEKVELALETEEARLAHDAFERLDKRLTRLVNRARLGRIETVLGRKRSLEIEVEALSQGLLPQTIVDSLRAERYLGSAEEYWPFEGEDWADEYVGGEGLR
jgi:hypothetical protein